MEERLEFLQSLVKPEYELFTTFLFRVRWVLANVVGCKQDMDVHRWPELIFLMGLKDVDQKFMVGLMKNPESDIVKVSAKVSKCHQTMNSQLPAHDVMKNNVLSLNIRTSQGQCHNLSFLIQPHF